MSDKKSSKRPIQVASRSTGVSNSNTMMDIRSSLPSIKSKGKFTSENNMSADASVEETNTGTLPSQIGEDTTPSPVNQPKAEGRLNLRASSTETPLKADPKIMASQSENSLPKRAKFSNVQDLPVLADRRVLPSLAPSLATKPISSDKKAVSLVPQAVSINNTFKEYYYQTMAGFSDGKTKTNQDAVSFFISLSGNVNTSLFCVFDGHGMSGHRVSDYLRNNVTSRLASNFSDIMEKHFIPDKTYSDEEYQKLLRTVCLELNRTLVANKSVNSFLSGSTGILVLLHGNSIICGNVGDSRAGIVSVPTLGTPKSNLERSQSGIDLLNTAEIDLKMMSTDHTPDLEGERRRVLQAGGVVMPCRDSFGNFVGPPRIWDKNEESPGLMMSRSFGDQLGHRVGMIAEPEVRVFQKGHSDRMVILGSDGLWEKLPQASILSICSKYLQGPNSAEKICKELVAQAAKKWDKVGDDSLTRRNAISTEMTSQR